MRTKLTVDRIESKNGTDTVRLVPLTDERSSARIDGDTDGITIKNASKLFGQTFNNGQQYFVDFTPAPAQSNT